MSRLLYWSACFLLIFSAACSPAAASTSLSTPAATPDCPEAAPSTENAGGSRICASGTQPPTATPPAQVGPALPSPNPPESTTSPSPTLLSLATNTTEGTQPSTQASPTPTTAATPCPPDQCSYSTPLFLMRPIAQPGNDSVDVTYRFGNTQGGRREPHHGVEFLNPYGTPVLAAADGVVVVAGEDSDPVSPPGAWPLVYLGMFSDFYGNAVVIQHPTPAALLGPFPDLPQTMYTLYAHLSEISVQVGQQVQAGQEIGKVGMSGVAQGPHLHFEVRLGEDLYRASRNPELWLRPHAGADGQLNGAMAGSFIDSAGNNLKKTSIVLEHLPNGPDQPNDLVIPLLSYEEKGLIGEPPWGESFGVGDIPPGLYRISFPHFGLQKVLFQVYPGQLTVITMHVE